MTLIERLRQDPQLQPWIATLEAVDLEGFDSDAPTGSALLDILQDMRVPREVLSQDEDVFLSVFQSDLSDIDRLPQDTTLQRSIVQHVRAGKHWYGGVGWCRL